MELKNRELIRRAQAGSIQAFEKLIQQYDRKVLALAYQIVGNTEDAEDVYQEVFIKVYRNLNRFRFESEFYTWLYRIVVNCAKSLMKKRKRYAHKSLDNIDKNDSGWQWTPIDPEPRPDTIVLNTELQDQIQLTLATIPLMQRMIFVLRFFQDFKIQDIAKITGIAEGTVKNSLFRSTRKMRSALSNYFES